MNRIHYAVKSQSLDFFFLTVNWSNVLFWQFVDQTLFSTDNCRLNIPFKQIFGQTLFSDNLLIKRSFPTICWSDVLFWQFVDQTCFSNNLSIKRFFLVNTLTKRSSLTFLWSNVLFWQIADQTFFSYSDVTLELPFTLSHPKPPEETPPPTPVPQQNVPTEEAAGTILGEGGVDQTFFLSLSWLERCSLFRTEHNSFIVTFACLHRSTFFHRVCDFILVATSSEEPAVDHNLIDFDTEWVWANKNSWCSCLSVITVESLISGLLIKPFVYRLPHCRRGFL